MLSPQRRERDLARVRSGEPFDVVVIGGGITGAGVALDAASRGMSVALIEAHDLAFGTSRWSSKLVHGGLRYLATGHAMVAWESAIERGHLMRTIAPHLVRPLAQLVPLMDDTPLASALLTRSGFAAGDAMRIASRTRRQTLPSARFISASKTRRLLPALDQPRVRGGMLAWDGSLEDDARLVVAVARTAASLGAHVLTHLAVIDASGEGVRVRDEHGDEFDIPARNVIGALGVWAGSLDPSVTVLPSRGTHIVLPAERLGRPRAAMTVKAIGEHARYCFALPRPDGLVIAGITDVEQPGAIPDVPTAPTEDVDWICRQLSQVLATPLTSADVIGSFAGLRPLVLPSGDEHVASSDVSREHLVQRAPNGMWTITGGKLTTYRRMAQDVVDKISEVPCQTTSIPLVGAGAMTTAENVPARLVRRLGTEAADAWSLVGEDPLLAEPLAPGLAARGIEVAWAVLAEGAVTADDVLERRTRLSFVPAHAAAARGRVEEILARYSAES